MIEAPTRPEIQPSLAKHGNLILEDGFTQLPRSVENYLNSLDLCPTAVLLLFILSSYRWQADQEFYPSVKTLAQRLNVSARRINQLTSQLCELGLLVKIERFAGRSQISNYYDLEPLYNRVAAWKNTEVATQLAQEDAQADEHFEPADVLEEIAQIVSEDYGEPEQRQIRYNCQRLRRRWDQHEIEYDAFCIILKKAAEQTEWRKAEPTRTGKEFTKLVPYFFSALDYHLQKVPAPKPPVPEPTTQVQPEKNNIEHAQAQSKPSTKSAILVARAAERKAAEAQGQRKARAPQTLELHIKAAASTFRDKQIKSSVQRAANLMVDAQLDEQEMLDLVADARAATSAAVNVKARMPYFFSVLEGTISAMFENEL